MTYVSSQLGRMSLAQRLDSCNIWSSCFSCCWMCFFFILRSLCSTKDKLVIRICVKWYCIEIPIFSTLILQKNFMIAMHIQIPSSKGQPKPPNHCDLDKNSDIQTGSFFYYRNVTSFKTLCIKFFFSRNSITYFLHTEGFLILACTVHTSSDC